ncbi:cysteine hydrolase family protein [Corallococcus llansteffanensis]|uniref:Cysteine hydrolase n=1 Tax=Corallococcus llansteffanensis TaxID=2316731 RepID=A0A3A8PE56_9BACT|nr:cysteine hydrolase family protein [Corallococcus llansteffanensis]RKH54688.1 cysteine hydrolase [Corallococcus llansteffanensis]
MQLDDTAVLISIDVQQGFDLRPFGPRNNPDMEAHALALLAAWRTARRPVVVVRHDSVHPDSPLAPGTPGNALKRGFEPQPGEPLVTKHVNSAFIGTDLESRLRAAGVRQVVLFGISTDMCVSTTARMAANLGFDLVVVGDACYTWRQPTPDGALLDGETIHRAHLTTLNSEFGRVVRTAQVIEALSPLAHAAVGPGTA